MKKPTCEYCSAYETSKARSLKYINNKASTEWRYCAKTDSNVKPSKECCPQFTPCRWFWCDGTGRITLKMCVERRKREDCKCSQAPDVDQAMEFERITLLRKRFRRG